jgi:hypothetical protein
VDNLKAQGFALRQLPPRFCSIAKLRFALPGLDIAQTEISPCPGIPGRVLDIGQPTTDNVWFWFQRDAHLTFVTFGYWSSGYGEGICVFRNADLRFGGVLGPFRPPRELLSCRRLPKRHQ